MKHLTRKIKSLAVIGVLVLAAISLLANFNKAYAAGSYSGPHGSNVFVMLVKTDNAGSSNSTQFTIPTTGSGYNYSVDCDNNGSFEATGQTGNYTCNYGFAGTYSVVISGTFPRIYFNYTGDKLKLLEVQQWGSNPWTSMASAFWGAANFNVTASDSPNLSGVTNTSYMFADSPAFNANISAWNVGNVTNMLAMFRGARSFNQPIGSWNVGSVTNMSSMFDGAYDFNADISDWNVGNVTNMSAMFAGTKAFNQDISGWPTSKVTNMSSMFSNAEAFNQDVGDLDMSAVTNAASMFSASGISIENYDAILDGWSIQTLKNNVTLGSAYNGLNYCNSGSQRQHIIDTYNWVIYDNGRACRPPQVATGNVVDRAAGTVTVEINIIDDGEGTVSSAGIRYSYEGDDGGEWSAEADNYEEGFQQVVTSIDCGTTYQYRAFVQTNAGMAYGDEATFTTLPCPDYKLDITLNSPGLIQNQVANYTFTASNVGPGPGYSPAALFIVTPDGMMPAADFDEESGYYTDGHTYQCSDGTEYAVDTPSFAYHLGNFYQCFVTLSEETLTPGGSASVTIPFISSTPVNDSTAVRAALLTWAPYDPDSDALWEAIAGTDDLFSLPINNIAIYTGTQPGTTITTDDNDQNQSSNTVVLPNKETNQTIRIQTPEDTTITCNAALKESAQTKQDNQYDYPLGLVEFCFNTEAQDNEVSLTFVTNLKPDQVTARKYNSTNGTYFDIPNATITETTYNGQHALRLTYTIQDNGQLDLDPATGSIKDPVGLAVREGSGSLASTGQSVLPFMVLAAALVSGSVLYILRRTRKHLL